MGVCHSAPPAFDDASDGEGYRQDGKRPKLEQRIQVQEKRSIDDSNNPSKNAFSSKGSLSPGMPSSPVAASSSGPTIQHRTHENTKSSSSSSSSRIITTLQSPQGTPIYYRQASNSIQHNTPPLQQQHQQQQQQQQQQQSLSSQHIISTIKQPHSQVGKGVTSGEPDHSDPGAVAQHGQFSYSEASVTQSPGEGYTYSVTHTHQTTDSGTGGSLTAVEGITTSTGAGSGSSQAQYSNIRLMYATLPFQVDTAHDEYFDADERASLMSTGVLRSGDSAIVENREALDVADNAAVNEIEMCDIEWKKGQLLGAGSYGQVYLGLNAHTGGLLAVKQVPLNQGVHTEQRVRQLEREIGILRRLSHQAIVAYKGVRVEDGNINIFLEYVPGGSIASLLSRFGKFNETLVRLYTKQILEGLKYLHQHQIVHRDIKGGNILVDINGQCKLADFGASLSLAEMAKEKPTIQGTPYWMAPEVIKQEGHGRKVDIWSVGCTVIEMISGRHPWKRFDTQAAALFHIARATEPPEIPAELSSDGRDFVEWCLKRDPKERPNVLKLLEHPFITGGKDKQINKGRAPLNAAPTFIGMDSEENKSIKRATEDKLPQEAAPPGLDFEGEVGEGQPHPGIADERAIISFLADCHAKMMANVSFEFRSSVQSLGNHLYD